MFKNLPRIVIIAIILKFCNRLSLSTLMNTFDNNVLLRSIKNFHKTILSLHLTMSVSQNETSISLADIWSCMD